MSNVFAAFWRQAWFRGGKRGFEAARVIMQRSREQEARKEEWKGEDVRRSFVLKPSQLLRFRF